MGINANSIRDNYFKVVRFEQPDFIPMHFHINDASYHAYDQSWLFDMVEAHEFLFPGFKRHADTYVPTYLPNARKDTPFTDDFGCVWETTDDGITGIVTGHPLTNLDDIDGYTFPDPSVCYGMGPIDWDAEADKLAEQKRRGDITMRGLRHGHTFLQLCDIRGYEALIYDMAEGEERLLPLIHSLEAFNQGIIDRYTAIGVDVMMYPEDLGMQIGPMISPELFREYIKPSYKRIMQTAIEKGNLIHMHSDGHLHALCDDLVDSGVDIISLQDLVNGIDWISDKYAGKICIELDIDRQKITAFGTPASVDALIREEVDKLGSKQGGLMMVYGLYPGIPVKNVEALMDAMERYAFYYS